MTCKAPRTKARVALVLLVLLLATACVPQQAPSQETPPPETATQAVTVSATPTPTGTPAPKDWAETFQLVKSGVAELAVTLCEGGGSGTGFLVGEDLIMTAAHVAKHEVDINVSVNGQFTLRPGPGNQ